MVKLELPIFPDVPPGFDPLPRALGEPSGVFSSAEEGHRRTQRKRARPEFYQPPAPPRRGRGRPPATPRCKGRPSKARLISLSSLQEARVRDSNKSSSTPLIGAQGQGQGRMPYYNEPANLTEEQSSSQVEDQVEPETNMNGTTRDKTIEKSINRSNCFQARYIEVPRGERSKNVGCNDKTNEGIDPTFLQHVANALDHASSRQTSVEYINVYSRSSYLSRILKAIEKKHGDITRNCSLKSEFMKALVLIRICKVVQDLRKQRLNDLDVSSLDPYYRTIKDAESMKVNVEWLHKRLDDIKEAVILSGEVKDVENERNGLVLNIHRKKSELVERRVELEKLKFEVRAKEGQLAQQTLKLSELDKKYYDYMSRISQFQHMNLNLNLMDGLV